MPDRFTGRGLDKLWFYFFVLHIPITILLDCQAIYPPSLTAHFPLLQKFLNWYLAFSRDPILNGAIYGGSEWGWLRIFLWMEGCFQLPCFILGAIGLWRNDKRVYPLLLIYASSTTTTLFPTLAALFSTKLNPPLSTMEMGLLLYSYIPFLVIPGMMIIDMTRKILRLIEVGQGRKRV